MCCPGAQMSPLGEGIFSTSEAIAREPFDLEKKFWYQNVPLIICNKIGLGYLGPEDHFEQ